MTVVFLDLDGTLVHSQPGIEAALRAAFRETERPELADTDLKWLLGPPMNDSFRTLGFSDPAHVLSLYRHHYLGGLMFEAEPYDGVFDMLDTLAARGCRLILMTAKPHEVACRITAHFDLARYMEAEFGPELDGTRAQKADLMAHALQVTGIDPATAVMVGDRMHDIDAARANDVRCIAARWGYGTPEEWAAADHIATHPGEIPDLVLKETA